MSSAITDLVSKPFFTIRCLLIRVPTTGMLVEIHKIPKFTEELYIVEVEYRFVRLFYHTQTYVVGLPTFKQLNLVIIY